MDRLVAPWPQGRALYNERSPITHIDRFRGALLLLQGEEDKVVPPNQAKTMYEALKARGIPVSYLLFEGEQHGFRKLETLRRALEAELYFYGRIFGFQPADRLADIPIDNLG
jgi:dipeptidyl aminopeptidase/acylaminoacyl peptidase